MSASTVGNWRKSRHSVSNGACVEVADGIRVRDTQNAAGPVLRFTPGAWTRFLACLKNRPNSVAPAEALAVPRRGLSAGMLFTYRAQRGT